MEDHRKFVLMLQILMLIHCISAISFSTHPNSAILANLVSSTVDTTKPCECRQLCTEDPQCTGVSVVDDGRPTISCTLTHHTPTQLAYAGLTESTAGVTSYFKDLPCMDNFFMVEGVGCIFISQETQTGTLAVKLCVEGSGLFFPKSVAMFDAMRRYLMSADRGSELWAGISKTEDEEVWRWRDGSYITAEQPNKFWGSGEPNNETPCARMSGNFGFRFRLADISCENTYPAICQQN